MGGNLVGYSLQDPHRNAWQCVVCGQTSVADGIASPGYSQIVSSVQLAWMRTHSQEWFEAPAHDPLTESLRRAFGIPTLSDIIYAATIPRFSQGLYLEDGTPIVAGINVPSREQMAAAEARMQSPCLKCGTTHRPWEQCAPREQGERHMAKDKGKKKKDKKAKAEAAETEATPPADPMEAAGVLDTPQAIGDVDLDKLITDLTNVTAALKIVNVELGSTETVTPAAEPEGKKGKKSKSEKTTSDEPADSDDSGDPVTYTEKALNKIGDKGAEGRKELAAICSSLGIPDSEVKGKRWGTLISMILTKQEEIANAGSGNDEFTSDTADADAASDWDEDVPPASEKKGKKKKKKKGKK